MESRLDKLNSDNPADKHILKLGQPLPMNGSCRHNKNSLKWMRYICCGRLFACGKSILLNIIGSCHNSFAQHKLGSAPTVVCGNCSKEQPSKNDKCNRWHNSFTGTAKAGGTDGNTGGQGKKGGKKKNKKKK